MMQLKILLPSGVLADKNKVERLVIQTASGSLGIWPARLDCVAALVPGILVYQCQDEGTVFVAVDTGVLIKQGATVLVSVRRAIVGHDLASLRSTVEHEFKSLSELDRTIQQATGKLQAGLIAGFRALHNA